MIVAADLPVMHVSSLGSALQDVAQGQRARTLRKRVKDFAKLSRCCAIVCGKSWPQGVGMVLDALASLAEGGSPSSALHSSVHALRFMECAGGVAVEHQYSRHPLVAARLQEHEAVMPSSSMRLTRKTPPTTLAIIVAMEYKVMDVADRRFTRMFSWYRLVRIWSAMRFDDHSGLIPSRQKLLSSCLRGSLVRTKTSGAGKKKQVLEVVVDADAYVVHSSWLRWGWELWRDTPQDRDLFLGLPSPDLSRMIHLEAKYADSVAMSRAL